MAAYEGQFECVRVLIEGGADLNIRDKSGAMFRGGVFKEGAWKVSETKYPGKTALGWAKERGHIRIVSLLKQHNAKE